MWLVGLGAWSFVHPRAAKQTPIRYFRAVMDFALQGLLRLAERVVDCCYWSHFSSTFQTRDPQCTTIDCRGEDLGGRDMTAGSNKLQQETEGRDGCCGSLCLWGSPAPWPVDAWSGETPLIQK